MTPPNPEPNTLRDILNEMTLLLEWVFPDVLGAPRIDREKQDSIKTEATQSIKQSLLELLPKKKDSSLASMDWLKWEMEGYNQAIDQITKSIETFCEGE